MKKNLLLLLFVTCVFSAAAKESYVLQKSQDVAEYDYDAESFSNEYFYDEMEQRQYCNECCSDPICRRYPVMGVWLPESPVLFRPLVADPRQICFSIGWRFNDQVLSKNVIDVSYADWLPIIEWCNVWPMYGRLRLEVEGALWAVFAPLKKTAPLINADYYVGIPITYASEEWSFRLRIFHVSSHIGDEFLIDHRHFHRRNPSA